jgi:hypothetical protein
VNYVFDSKDLIYVSNAFGTFIGKLVGARDCMNCRQWCMYHSYAEYPAARFAIVVVGAFAKLRIATVILVMLVRVEKQDSQWSGFNEL